MGAPIAICGLALVGVSVVFFALFNKARIGALPLNHVTGLRTKTIMSSEDVWIAVHRKYAWVFMVPGIGFLLTGLSFILSTIISVLSSVVMPVFYVVFGIMLIVLVAASVSADKHARSIQPQEGTR